MKGGVDICIVSLSDAGVLIDGIDENAYSSSWHSINLNF